MTISADEIILLNKMNSTASAVQLGTLISNAESVAASEIALAEGSLLIGNSSTVGVAIDVKGSGKLLIGNGTTATSASVTGDITLSSAGLSAIGANKVLLAMLHTGVRPSHVAKFGGTHTTAGGDAAETITATGAVAGDLVLVSVRTSGTGTRTVMAAVADTDVINVTMSGDPTNDHVLEWLVFRAAA